MKLICLQMPNYGCQDNISEHPTALQSQLLEVRQSLETEQRMREKAEAEQRELRALLEQRVREASIGESVADRVEQTTQTIVSDEDEGRSDVQEAYQKQTQELQQELDAMRGEVRRAPMPSSLALSITLSLFGKKYCK